jgi:hypothetical protein
VSEEMMGFDAKERQALNREGFDAAGSNADFGFKSLGSATLTNSE